MKSKYIKTDKNQIIVFSELQNHSDFQHFNPVSAGFVQISGQEDGWATCKCYGKSVTLNIESDPEKDEFLVKKQILGYESYML